MSTAFVLSLSIVVGVVLGARLLVPALPVSRHATPVSVTDAVLAGIGVAGLALHCGSMFFRSVVDALPGTGRAISEIDALATTSMVWYAVPAALVVFGLRRQHPAALLAVALALTAVGITMYDGGSLETHLTAIFVAVVVLATVASTLVVPPWRNRTAFR